MSEYNGSKAVGITINGPGCITEIIPSSFKIPNTSYYRYIVDVSFPVSVFKDRNVNFLLKDLIQGYTIKIIDSQNLKIYKIVDKEYSLGDAIYQPNFNASTTYRF